MCKLESIDPNIHNIARFDRIGFTMKNSNDSILVVHIRTFLNIWYKLPKKGTGLGPGIPRDTQYPKCHVKYLQKTTTKIS